MAYLTDDLIKNKTYTEFADLFGFNPDSVKDMINGNTQSLFGWFCPKNKYRPKYYHAISPEGVCYKIWNKNVTEFCRQHGIPDASVFRGLLLGKTQSSYGWKRPDSKPLDPDRNGVTKYKLVKPNGEIIEGQNISRLARENSLDYDCLIKVIEGKNSHHRGWRLYTEENAGKKFDKFEKFRNSDKYKFISPNGDIYKTGSLNLFSKECGISSRYLSYLWRGKVSHVRGWKRVVPS